MKKILRLSFILLLLCTACKPNRQTANSDKPTITVTIEPLRYFTEALTGERFKVVSMVPQGSSPETYDPTPKQLRDLAQSEACLLIGYIGFEQTWRDRLKENAPDLHFFDVSKGVALITDGTQAKHHPDETDGHHHHHNGVEPHIWNSTTNARIIAGNILHALCDIDPEGEEVYRERYDSLCREIEETDRKIRDILSNPRADRAFMIYHPALSYFARDYGLRQIPIEADGKEPSPAHLKELIDLCRREKLRIIFIQPEFDRHNATLIARQTGTQIVPINPLAYNWREELIRTAESLAQSNTDF